ncbi:hypothetical protein CCACVL1_04426 [Corchorus capsularis]|uniref:Uncharacterized protein n=1 Tax=Corchorus capsularis TaxID=210143 RepID=A0A1R3JSL6_COCAP|nr:hypothetical protein CCACVL1_04426 [Corchorus capsularis]
MRGRGEAKKGGVDSIAEAVVRQGEGLFPSIFRNPLEREMRDI